jgi:Spy/CpxP family protein refolding chaperone
LRLIPQSATTKTGGSHLKTNIMKLNKALLIAALAAGSLFASGIPSQAQDNTNTPPAGAPPGGMRARPSFDMLAKQLDLTDDQKPKVKAILDDQQQKMRDLRQDTSVAQADKRAKAKEIREATTAKLKDILTADQFAKWQKVGQRQRPAAAPPQQ